MKTLFIPNGHNPDLRGNPEASIIHLPRPSSLAVVPSAFPFVKPRLQVKEGDRVSLGSPLFEDKRRPELRFLSPGGGIIENIIFGPRRIVTAIIIRLDEKEEREFFQPLENEDLETMDREELMQHLVKGGLWPLFRSLPFRAIADTKELPDTLYVRMDSHQPFSALPEAYLQGHLEAFRFGIRVLKKLAGQLAVYTCAEQHSFVLNECQGVVNHTVFGRYPAQDPGVVHYHLRKKGNTGKAWFITGEDVLLIAHLLETGTYPGERTYAMGGTGLASPCHVRTRFGAPVSHLIEACDPLEGNFRNIAGGLFRGRNAGQEGFMSMYETSLTRIPEGKEKEYFGFMRPGLSKNSVSRTFLSALFNRPAKVDCNTHGEERACINCGTCTRLCPVEMLPQFTMKALHADAIEEALAHGLLDCVQCGLCAYACPSKIDLSGIFGSAREKLYQEQQKGA
ncbi:4Fe-4S dicluster domain-containing protein [Desulfobotulus mexicanus]|uniref:Na(+)-translocating NADH-quinone reductase subunit A n=1 Tax=Desulfobotulus mexicanus TaxID=2586642 RepID=A0A5S5MCU7_9BACT|nr:4Fe-4S dicluster domain-containing protein [Desulfobotulus mexicanus]TYT73455.1 4Fe-4S dicluster domain-containing protein [Desulfobotulus mexicanus]